MTNDIESDAVAAAKVGKVDAPKETLPEKAYRQAQTNVAMGGTHNYLTPDVQSALKQGNPQVEGAVLRGSQDAQRALKPADTPKTGE